MCGIKKRRDLFLNSVIGNERHIYIMATSLNQKQSPAAAFQSRFLKDFAVFMRKNLCWCLFFKKLQP